jgi:Protein of unknown function (DUF3118).
VTAIKIAGITRYSVIAQRSFAATRDLDPESARQVIWRPERLAHRERLFRAIALPSLDEIAARHEQFRHFVLVSADFPQPFKRSLEAMAASRPWFQIVEVGPSSDFSVMKAELGKFVGEAKAFVFRLDDDDALAPAAFLDAVLSNADCAAGTVLSLDEGYMIRPGWNSVSLVKEKIPFNSAGLGVYSQGPNVTSIHDLGNQNKIAEKGYPVIHIRGRMWLRSKTDTSDTTMKYWKRWRYLPISKSRLQQQLDEKFPGLHADSVIDAITAEVG